MHVGPIPQPPQQRGSADDTGRSALLEDDDPWHRGTRKEPKDLRDRRMLVILHDVRLHAISDRTWGFIGRGEHREQIVFRDKAYQVSRAIDDGRRVEPQLQELIGHAVDRIAFVRAVHRGGHDVACQYVVQRGSRRPGGPDMRPRIGQRAEAHYAISTGFLGDTQRLVGQGQHRLGAGGVGQTRGNAEAGINAQYMLGERDTQVGHGLPHAVGPQGGFFFRGLGQHRVEFFAATAGHACH